MWLRFTEGARKVVIGAQERAHAEQSAEVEPRHLLWASLGEGSGLSQALAQFGVTPAMAIEALCRAQPGPTASEGEPGADKHFSEPAKAALQSGYIIARELTHPYVGSRHIAAGLLSGVDAHVAEVFERLGVAAGPLRQAIMQGPWPDEDDEPPVGCGTAPQSGA